MNPRKKKKTKKEARASIKTSEKGDKKKEPSPSAEIPQREDEKPEDRIEEYKDRLQRKTAEFSNYQKRIQKEISEIQRYSIKPLALELLSVLDDFERALDAVSDLENDFVKGFRMIREGLQAALSNHGVEPIEAQEKPFDPNLHDAIMEKDNPDLPDKTVLEEFKKGYMLYDRLLRPATVSVSRIPNEPEAQTKDCEKNDD